MYYQCFNGAISKKSKKIAIRHLKAWAKSARYLYMKICLLQPIYYSDVVDLSFMSRPVYDVQVLGLDSTA